MRQEVNYEIGDRVKYVFSDDINRIYQIVADRERPYKHQVGEIYPNEDNDFVIIPVHRESFEPFVHVRSGELRTI